MKIGDKYIWKPYNHATKSDDKDSVWYGHIVTVIEFDTHDRAWISVDDFPNCNYRERKNRFCADKAELFEVEHD